MTFPYLCFTQYGLFLFASVTDVTESIRANSYIDGATDFEAEH
jgi:hypothetical protein